MHAAERHLAMPKLSAKTCCLQHTGVPWPQQMRRAAGCRLQTAVQWAEAGLSSRVLLCSINNVLMLARIRSDEPPRGISTA